MRKSFILFVIYSVLTSSLILAQENTNKSKFKQLKEELATPNVYRTASGAPGPEYYQQKADYKIDVVLDDQNQKISGEETVTYTNNSPDVLSYIWMQLDQNMRAKDSDSKKIKNQSFSSRTSYDEVLRWHNDFDGGFKIEKITDLSGKELKYSINKTMMRIDLPKSLQKGQSFSFKVKWWYNINDRMKIGGRSGYEYFEEEDNYLYTIAQFFPRMAVYNDVEGWQNKQFLGMGEFSLPFGDYDVNITVPSDHVVSATGELQNSSSVLSKKQQERLKKARTEFDQPVFIINQKEAELNEKNKAGGSKTWSFKAKNVRDFAFASSRKFIWDAMAVKVGGKTVMAMSFYPKEGNPLWEKYSTKVVAHTIKTYSKYTIDYPYPVAQSVNAKSIGMEYPMICFNFGRPETDGTYTKRTKYGVIGVIIHEVGHNFFPMIINSDERQWTWMDEGLNTFVQYLTEQEWERDYPSRRGPAHKIVHYMKGDKKSLSPIMTNSESILQFGNNAYSKPATALNILRETVMGRELFDFAFKTYANRWAFKHPTPADFFRTMEDASAVDLDWFWRGWFYTTDHVDIGIESVKWFQLNTKDPKIEKPIAKKKSLKRSASKIKDNELIKETYMDRDPKIADFYNSYDQFETTVLDEKAFERYVERLSEKEKKLLAENYNYYQINFKNIGGLVMPIIMEITYDDNSTEYIKIPAEIWLRNNKEAKKVIWSKNKVIKIELDPLLETADTDRDNNYWPAYEEPTRFELFKQRDYYQPNPMQKKKIADEINQD